MTRIKVIPTRPLRLWEPATWGIITGALVGLTLGNSTALGSFTLSFPLWSLVTIALVSVPLFGAIDALAHRRPRRLAVRQAICALVYPPGMMLTAIQFPDGPGYLSFVDAPLEMTLQMLIWFPMALASVPLTLLIAFLLTFFFGAHEAHTPSLCGSCAYDLSGLTDVSICPECGSDSPTSPPRESSIRRFAWRGLAVFACAISVAVTTGVVFGIARIVVPALRTFRTMQSPAPSDSHYRLPPGITINGNSFNAVSRTSDVSHLAEPFGTEFTELHVTVFESSNPECPRVQAMLRVPAPSAAEKATPLGALPRSSDIYWQISATDIDRFLSTGGFTDDRIREIVRRTAEEIANGPAGRRAFLPLDF